MRIMMLWIISCLAMLHISSGCIVLSPLEKIYMGTQIASQILWGISACYMRVKVGKAVDVVAKGVDGSLGKSQEPETKHRGHKKKLEKNDSEHEESAKTLPNPEGLKTLFAGDIPREITEIIEFLSNPEKFLRLGVSMPKGILLVGPPGTGKTTIARAIAKSAGCLFIAADATEFIELYVGTGAKRVRELFDQARDAIESGEHKAVIIFIDEVDAIGCKRESDASGASREYVQTLLQLLTLMDGFEQDESIIVIAATNRPESLDPALLRPGRFDRKVIIGLPDCASREAILCHYLQRCPVGDIDVAVLAQLTKGFSGAQLKQLVNEAAIRAARVDAHQVEMIHCMLALKEIYGIVL